MTDMETQSFSGHNNNSKKSQSGWMAQDAGESFSGDASERIQLKDLIRIVFERKMAILFIALTVMASVAFSVFWLISPTYEAKARIHFDIQAGAIPVLRTSSTFVSDAEKLALFETIMQEMKNREIAENVVRKLELDSKRVIGNIELIKNMVMDLRTWIGFRAGIASWQKKRNPFAASCSALSKNFTVNRLENSTILELVYEAKSPDECKHTLDAIIDEVIAYRNSFIHDKASSSSGFLLKEIERIRSEINKAEDEWSRLMENDAFPLAEESLSGIETEKNSKEVAITGVSISDRITEEMRLYVIKMQEELTNTLSLYSESHPSVPRLRKTIQSYAKVINGSYAKKLKLNRIKREVTGQETVYNELLSAYQNTLVMESSDLRRLGTLKMIQPPDFPDSKKSPQRVLAMAASVFLGLMLGIAYSFLAYTMDSSLRNPEDVKRHLGINNVLSVPRI